MVVAVLGTLWVTCSVGGGAVLALLAMRIHEGLSFRRLWIFYTAVLAFATAAVLAIAWF